MLLEAAIGILLALLIWKITAKPQGLPPGFWGLPYFGYIPVFSRKNIEETVDNFVKKNGESPLITWRMGTQIVVFVLQPDSIREAFIGKDFVDRPYMRVFGFVGGSTIGLVLGNGIPWRNTRRFTLHHLRDLGMGKSSLLPVIQTEAGKMVEEMKSKAGKPSKLPISLVVGPLNVIWQMVASRRYDIDDPEVDDYLKLLYKVRNIMFGITVMDFMPWLTKILPDYLRKKVYEEDLLLEFACNTKLLMKKYIDEHLEKIDYDNPKDFIDDYLLEMKNNENNPESTFSMDDLIISVTDLFGAGAEATSMNLIWMVLYLAHYPEVQKRVQNEIDSKLDKDFIASDNQKKILPYTEAFITEVIRCASTLKLGVMHKAVDDSQLSGYRIPKDAIVTPIPILTNYDPKYWDNPSEFRPERFLDEDGHFFLPKDKGFYPFGVGKRVCIGETLASAELSIFVSTMVQHIEFSPLPGKSVDMSIKENTFVRYANLDQEIMMTLR